MSDADFDEGTAFCMGGCVLCGRLFTFNPLKVNSIRLRPDGPRQQICRPCVVDVVNPALRERGEPEAEILPGAYYDEGAP